MNNKDIIQEYKDAKTKQAKAWIITKGLLMLVAGTALFFALTSVKVLLVIACIAFIAGGSN